jgi:hypothetical protein
MQKIAPLIGLTVGTVFVLNAAIRLPNPLANQPQPLLAPPAAGGGDPPDARPDAPPAPPPAPAAQGVRRPNEPAYKAVIRCLGDLDDLLDTVRGPASFAAVKPALLRRARQHAAQASDYPDQGLARLGRAAAREMQQAMNRHTESLARAIQVAPEVRDFFAKDIAAVLRPK